MTKIASSTRRAILAKRRFGFRPSAIAKELKVDDSVVRHVLSSDTRQRDNAFLVVHRKAYRTRKPRADREASEIDWQHIERLIALHQGIGDFLRRDLLVGIRELKRLSQGQL
jgi:hypothetical protein